MSSITALSEYKKSSLINAGVILVGLAMVFLRHSLPGIVLEVSLFILSLVILVRAADVFTDLAVIVGERLGLSKLNTGILIIAIGTSAPELFASIGAMLNNQPEMIVGNVLGTVVANCLLGIGIAAMFAKQPLDVHRDVLSTQMSVFLVSVLLTGLALIDGHFTRLEGIVLLVVLGFYLRHNILYTKEPASDEDNQDEAQKDQADNKQPIGVLSILLVVNLACLFASGDIVVSSLSNGAELLGLSSAKLATSLLAIGTSIPEIVTAIMLVKKNNTDSLFGEIIGSNIFDYLGIFGVISVIKPITMSGPLLDYLLLSSVGAYFLLFIIMNDRKIRHIEGIALLALFAGFLIQLTSI